MIISDQDVDKKYAIGQDLLCFVITGENSKVLSTQFILFGED